MSKPIYLPTDAAAGTGSLRTLGTGATQAAVGSHSHAHSAITGIGIDDHHARDHAASHDPGGADALKDPTRLSGGPASFGYLAWNATPLIFGTSVSPSAGVVYLCKIMTSYAYTVNNIDFGCGTAGTGAGALANCFVGLYDSGGTRRFVSADQSTPWASGSGTIKAMAVAGGYTVTANDFIYIAFLVGTQSSTLFKITSTTPATHMLNANLTAATQMFANQLTGQTTLPTNLTLSSNSASGNIALWVAVR